MCLTFQVTIGIPGRSAFTGLLDSCPPAYTHASSSVFGMGFNFFFFFSLEEQILSIKHGSRCLLHAVFLAEFHLAPNLVQSLPQWPKPTWVLGLGTHATQHTPTHAHICELCV